jgi:glutaredoxin
MKVSQMKIEVHSKTDCPYCVKAKLWLTDRNIPFDLFVYDDESERAAMYDRLGLDTGRTVPQIIVDGVRLGGYTDLLNSDVEDRFNAGKFDADF